MDKLEFLEILERELKELPREEKENVLAYYREYFEEAGIEKESEVVRELGDPRILAQRILGENRTRNSQAAPCDGAFREAGGEGGPPDRKRLSPGWIALIVIVGFPLWIMAGALAFCVVIFFGMLILGLGLASVIMVPAGVLCFAAGIFMSFFVGATGLFVSGLSLVAAGLGLLLWLATAQLSRIFVTLIDKVVQKFASRRSRNG